MYIHYTDICVKITNRRENKKREKNIFTPRKKIDIRDSDT